MPPDSGRLIIAATLDEVERDEIFRRLPLHMPILDQFNIGGGLHRDRLMTAMDAIFDDGETVLIAPPSKNHQPGLYGGKLIKTDEYGGTPARFVENVSSGPWFGLRALVKSLGEFDKDYPFQESKSREKLMPRICDTPERQIQKNEAISFASVALMAVYGTGRNQTVNVIESIPLRSRHG